MVLHMSGCHIYLKMFLFWFLVMSLLSSLDEKDVRVKLLADDLWEAEDDKRDFLSVGVDTFDRLFLKTTNFLAHGAN